MTVAALQGSEDEEDEEDEEASRCHGRLALWPRRPPPALRTRKTRKAVPAPAKQPTRRRELDRHRVDERTAGTDSMVSQILEAEDQREAKGRVGAQGPAGQCWGAKGGCLAEGASAAFRAHWGNVLTALPRIITGSCMPLLMPRNSEITVPLWSSCSPWAPG